MPGFTGCQVATRSQISLLISRCTVSSKKLKCYWCRVLFIVHILKKMKWQWRATPCAQLDWKWVVSSSLKCPSVGLNVILKGHLSQKGDQGMQHKSVSVETLTLETFWWANKAPVLNFVESRVSGRGDQEFQPVPHQNCLMDFHVEEISFLLQGVGVIFSPLGWWTQSRSVGVVISMSSLIVKCSLKHRTRLIFLVFVATDSLV